MQILGYVTPPPTKCDFLQEMPGTSPGGQGQALYPPELPGKFCHNSGKGAMAAAALVLHEV